MTTREVGIETMRRDIAEQCADGPTAADLVDAPVLVGWSIDSHPKLGGPVLRGRVFGHPLIEAGTAITTSHVALLDDGWARTISRYYRLGRPAGESLH